MSADQEHERTAEEGTTSSSPSTCSACSTAAERAAMARRIAAEPALARRTAPLAHRALRPRCRVRRDRAARRRLATARAPPVRRRSQAAIRQLVEQSRALARPGRSRRGGRGDRRRLQRRCSRASTPTQLATELVAALQSQEGSGVEFVAFYDTGTQARSGCRRSRASRAATRTTSSGTSRATSRRCRWA